MEQPPPVRQGLSRGERGWNVDDGVTGRTRRRYVVRDNYGIVREGTLEHGENAVPSYTLGYGQWVEYLPTEDEQRLGEELSEPRGPDDIEDRAATIGPRTVLAEAQALVYGEREKTYGHPAVDFKRTAILWRAYLRAKYDIDVPFTTFDISKMQRDVKDARLMESPLHRDSHVDIAGYVAAGARAVGVDD